jgi:GNAT superfamily N-acetyltransferase
VFRSPVHVRDAAPDDAPALVEVWSGPADRHADGPADHPADNSANHPADHPAGRGADLDTSGRAHHEAVSSVARIAADPDQRLLVAVIDDQVVGATHLLRAPLSPIHAEAAVYVMHLQVLDHHRRHGVGRALLEATVTWAEEKDTSHVVAAAAVASRDANRFMARLGLAQIAVVRGATVPALRAKLPVEPPAAARVGSRSHRNVGQVLVQRRSLRRARTRPT